jgi:hypothetical protein
MLPALPGAFFVSGNKANLFAKVDGSKKGRTQCGIPFTGLKPPFGMAEGNPPLSASQLSARSCKFQQFWESDSIRKPSGSFELKAFF